jgi:hypothetical protein
MLRLEEVLQKIHLKLMMISYDELLQKKVKIGH